MKNSSIRLFAFVCVYALLFKCQLSYAQSYLAHIKKIGIKEGLSSYNINEVLHDKEGVIWIATDYGLNRYDGAAIKTYTKEENGLCHNNVIGLFEDEHQMLWISAGDKGGDWFHCIFDKRKEKFYSLEEYLGQKPPFVSEKTQTYCMGKTITFCEEVNIGEGKFNCFEFNGKQIVKVFSAKRSNPFIADKIQEGFFKSNENEYLSFWRSKDDAASLVIVFDANGQLKSTYHCDIAHPKMLCTRSYEGLHCIFCVNENGKNWQLNLHVNEKPVQNKDIILKNNWGERIAISKTKTYIIDKDSLHIYYKNGEYESSVYHGLSLKEIYLGLPLVDRDGNIWLYDQEHLYCISLVKKQFNSALQQPNQPIRLRGISQNQKGNIIAGTYSHLYEVQANKSTIVKNIPPYNYLGILKKEDAIWFGTEGFRLCKLNTKNNQVEEFFISGKDPSSIIWIPFITKEGAVWAGGNRGLYRLDTKKRVLVSFKDEGGLGVCNVYALHQNKKGTWLCTSNGLYLVDLTKEKILKHYSKKLSEDAFLPAEHFVHLHEDSDGVFWLATKGEGLIKWDPKTGNYKQYTQNKSGLSHNVLYSVYGDSFGYLWLSSQRGLMRFHKESGLVNCYLNEDGLPHNEFNTISHYQAPNGHLYYGGQNGLVHFDPKIFEKTDKQHPFIISNYSKEIKGTDSLVNMSSHFFEKAVITINPSDKAAILKLALLDYQNSENHLYGYQILGYDTHWHYQKENTIQISGLPYGDYELKLRAKNANAGSWIDYPKRIRIEVVNRFI